MNVEIIDKGNTSNRLTVDAHNNVRIKFQTGLTEQQKAIVKQNFVSVAQHIIYNNLNTQTLRGKCEFGDDGIKMYTGTRTTRKWLNKILW